MRTSSACWIACVEIMNCPMKQRYLTPDPHNLHSKSVKFLHLFSIQASPTAKLPPSVLDLMRPLRSSCLNLGSSQTAVISAKQRPCLSQTLGPETLSPKCSLPQGGRVEVRCHHPPKAQASKQSLKDATRSKKLLGTNGIATRSKKRLVVPGHTTRNKNATSSKGHRRHRY